MNRRTFLTVSAGASAGLLGAAPGVRTFQVTTDVDVPAGQTPTRVWLPAPVRSGIRFQTVVSEKTEAPGGRLKVEASPKDGLRIVRADFPAGVPARLTMTITVARRSYEVALLGPDRSGSGAPASLRYFLRPTKLLPLDGIVKETAETITRGVRTDLSKARAIYDWIVENTFRDPKVQGCGIGDIRFMLESRNLGGKCADLNALFVGLARASGLPARDVYGIRTVPGDITKSQHCRAEVFIGGYGWVPMDPADVRKAALEGPPEKMVRARTHVFGGWDQDWIAYNFAHDVTLPESARKPLGYFMYPQAETAGGRLDSLAPDSFRYRIIARET